MGKDSNFTGQPVYSQILNLLDRERIMQISRETEGSEAYVKRFDGYQHLVVMLFGILNHFDSLRELEIGMKAEAHKLHHLGLNYMVRRSTLAEANIRRPQEFFAKVYAYLLERYAKFLADSRPPKSYKGQTHEPKDWEKLLYMMDSTTITLFDNILKGVGRHPKSGKKKGGMKVHTVMKYHVGVPMVVQLTSAAKHDHYLLKEVHLPKDSTLAIDRAYIDIAQFQRLTEEGVCYVTKMKKNLKYEVLESVTYVNPDGLVTHIDQKVLFTRDELTHEARRVEIFDGKKKPVVLLTNSFDFSVEDISEIYRLRWAIESLYKQLKQNFPLHFFYGDSVNAIQVQTWVVLIANLLITVLSRSIKRNCAFSQVVTMVRLTLMYYIDFVVFMKNPDIPIQIKEYVYLTSRNIVRFVDRFFRIEKVEKLSEYEANCMVYQSLRGDNNYLTAFAGDEKGIKAIADGFVRSIYGDIESFSYEGTDVSAEVLNVNNGLYVTKLSSVGIKEVSDSPVIRNEKTKITGVKDFYKIPLSVEGAAVDLIICFNNDWTVE